MKKQKEIKLVDIKTIRFSPEIEVELPSKTDSKRLINRGKTLKGWEIKEDISLDNGIELSPENPNHLYYTEESLLQIKEILALIRVYRGKINPKTCGFHLHVNVKRLSDKQILMIIKEFIHRQRFIVKKFHVHPVRLEDTCKLLPKSELYKLTEKEIHSYRNRDSYTFQKYRYIDDKFHSLNVNHMGKGDYGTVEFRLFGGSLNYREIKERIYWTLCFIKDCLERE